MDVAATAGVSLATVDRVLNRRPGVRSATIEKVQSAVEHLGYVRNTAAANLVRQRTYRLIFILPQTANEFVAALEHDIADQSAERTHERTALECVYVPPFDPAALVHVLDALDADVDGVAVFGPETLEVRAAVQRARQRNIAVAAFVADLPNSERDHFIGIDNTAAGRTAATLVGRLVKGPGKVLLITGSSLAYDHIERREGFDAVMAEKFADLEVLDSLEGRDDPEVIRSLLPGIFAAYPDIRAIYSSAAGNPGLIRYLDESEPRNDLVIVAHELTETSRDALARGVFDAVISQDTGHLVRSATRLLRATADNAPFNSAQERIRIDIYLSENLPAEAPKKGGT